MAITTTTTADSTIPELWSAITADAREENLILFNMFDRRYEDEAGRQAYDTIHIQGVNNFGTGALTLGVGGSLTYEAAAFATQVNLLIDTHAYHAFELETEAELMSNINLMAKLSTKSAYALALRMDDDAAGMIDDFSTNVVGVLGQAADEEDWRTASRMLDDAIAPDSDRMAAVSPIQGRHMEGIEVYRNSLYGGSNGQLNTNQPSRGFMFRAHGADFFKTGNVEGSNAAGHDCGMWHREAVAVAVIDMMRVETMFEIDDDSDKKAVHSIYGLIEVRDNHGVFVRAL